MTWHGRFDADWKPPRRVTHDESVNRADQGSKFTSDEFLDRSSVQRAKAQVLAGWLRETKHCVAYAGAGLSRTSGIPDYASSRSSVVAKTAGKALQSPLDAQPTHAHYVISALVRAGMVHSVVNQNHDGLVQKSGVPEALTNDIHGAWYDPSNPVVQFNGNLRSDHCDAMVRDSRTADLVLAVGTSLCGMNADRVVHKTASRGGRTVVVNLQKTCADDKASLRVWALLDKFFGLVADELGLDVPTAPLPKLPACDEFELPLDPKTGCRDPNRRTVVSLAPGSTLRVVDKYAPTSVRALEMKVAWRDDEGNIRLICERPGKIPLSFTLGRWWVAEFQAGALSRFPVVPV